MSDLISRQAAIDALKEAMNLHENTDDERSGLAIAIHIIKFKLPSAQPERKTGKWYIDAEGDVRCTACKTKCLRDDIGINILSNYCPNCGSDMRGKNEQQE